MTNSAPPHHDIPRIGLGWDRHRLVAGRPCTLGGLDFESTTGPDGHSDGDALLHALCDALLGAAGLDDLGTMFPDTDPLWRDAPSRVFVEAAIAALAERKLRVWSADLVVICDHPKLSPRRTELRAHLAAMLDLPSDRVNVKGKTTEGCDSDWLEAQAVVLVGPA